jgi:myo-inositol-1-phosphate synthase
MSGTPRIGLWLLGARGSVATTAVAGLLSVREGSADHVGLVTSTPPFRGAELPPLAALVVGGHDLSSEPLPARAERLAAGGVLPAALLTSVRNGLAEVDGRIRPGISADDAATAPAEALARVTDDLTAFRTEHALDEVVVVQLTSTEPAADPCLLALDLDGVLSALSGDGPALPASVVYATGALLTGCAFVDFTPSVATVVPGVQELAESTGLPLAGRDGKTGETLLRSALAPMFVERALAVRSWAGTNLLGGGDGASLADPVRRKAKLAAKAGTLQALLGEDVETPLTIEHVADLGEWKTAWDHVVFEGFLGTRMKLQLTWEGCDSALAAPLVLDLARLVAAALMAGERGPLPALGYFFKDPLGSDEHRLSEQFVALRTWAHKLRPDLPR